MSAPVGQPDLALTRRGFRNSPAADIPDNWHRCPMTKKSLAAPRTWAVCLIAYCAACTSAVACMPGSPASLIDFLFEHVPTDIDAPVVIEATVYDATDNVSYAHDGLSSLSR